MVERLAQRQGALTGRSLHAVPVITSSTSFVWAGSWYCSPGCRGIAGRIQERVSATPQPLGGDHSWQVLRGKDGTHATTWALKAAQVRGPCHAAVRGHPRHLLSSHSSLAVPGDHCVHTDTLVPLQCDVFGSMRRALSLLGDPKFADTVGMTDTGCAGVYEQARLD